MIVPKSERIDLNRPQKITVHVSQDDNTREILVSLYRDQQPYDVTADVSGETVIMAVQYIYANGYGDSYTQTQQGEAAVEQDANTRNLYKVRIDGAATERPGRVDILVKFYTDAGQVLHSFPLTLNVKRSRGSDVDPDGGDPSHSKYLRIDVQPDAAAGMTQPIGKTSDGQLVTYPTTQPDQAVIDAVVKSSFAQFNAYNLVGNIQGRENRGVTFTGDGSSCTCEGTATDYDATCIVFNTTNALPAGFEAGKSYALDFTVVSNIPTNKLKLAVTLRGAGVSNTYPANTTTTLTLPANTTGISINLLVSNGDEVDCTATLTILSAKTNRELEDGMDDLSAEMATVKAAGQTTQRLVDNLGNRNARNLIPVPLPGSTAVSGVTFVTAAGSDRITYSGTATATAKYNLINSPAAMPEGFVAGQTSHITFLAADAEGYTAMQLRVEQYRSGGYSTSTYSPNTEGGIDLAVNSNTIGIVMYLYVANGSQVSGACTVELLNTATNQQLVAEDARLSGRIDTMQAAVTEAGKTDEITANRLDMDGFILGVSSAGSANAARAMSAPMLVKSGGIYVRAVLPNDVEIKVDFYTSDALSGTPQRWYPNWKTSIDEGQTGYEGKYCRIELHTSDDTTPITAAKVAACKIYVVDGLKPIIYVPHRSAVDSIARNTRGPVTFRVLSNNASQISYDAGTGSMGSLPNAEFIPVYKQKLYEAGANVAFFQEFPNKMDDGTTEAVDALLKPIFANVITANINTSQQMAIASNYPIVDHGEGTYSGSSTKYMWALLNIHGALVYVLNLHFTTVEATRLSEIAQAIALMKAWPVYFGGGDTNIGTGTGSGTETEQAEYDEFHKQNIQTSNGGFVGLIPTSHDNVRSYDTFVACASVAMSQFSAVPNSTSYGTNHQMVVGTMTLPLDGSVEVPVILPEEPEIDES